MAPLPAVAPGSLGAERGSGARLVSVPLGATAVLRVLLPGPHGTLTVHGG